MVLPHLPAAAALSAAHLSAILFPATLRRLYIARDDDPAGDGAMTTLNERARAVGIEAISLSPRLGDFNQDLRIFGADELCAERTSVGWGNGGSVVLDIGGCRIH